MIRHLSQVFVGSYRVDVIDRWTGRHACAFQAAARLTQDEFAVLLGVARRTVAGWHEKPEVVLRAEMQRALDTAYERSTDFVKIRLARHLRDDDVKHGSQVPDSGAVSLTVAIAIVLKGTDILVVCRRDPDPSGITWQFPAGVVKPGAVPETVAVRETLAETGIHCRVVKSLGSRLHPMSNVFCEYFLCEYLAGTVENLDEAENVSALWVPAKDVTRFIPSDRLFEPVLSALKGTA